VTAEAKEKVVWHGPKSLRRLLVPIADLEPFPGNPRRGDVDAVVESLRRFGQQRPVLVNGGRIIAGHHVVLAAGQEGWTHVAALAGDFATDEEARAYLIADNGTHDRGDYDWRQLRAQLEELAKTDSGLAGTGYAEEDLRWIDRQIAELDKAAQPPAAFPGLDPDDLDTAYRCPSCGYEWSGNPAPGKDPDDTSEDPE
jgi:ParB-like chromosome segregation protein Spo0J